MKKLLELIANTKIRIKIFKNINYVSLHDMLQTKIEIYMEIINYTCIEHIPKNN